MKWKTFWQVVLLMIIAGAIIYSISPRYHFSDYNGIFIKADKITGKVMGFSKGVDAEGKPTKTGRGWILVK